MATATLLTDDDIRQLLRTAAAPYVRKGLHSTGLLGWCQTNKVTPSHAYEFINGQRPMPPSLVKPLGLEYRIVQKAANNDGP